MPAVDQPRKACSPKYTHIAYPLFAPDHLTYKNKSPPPSSSTLPLHPQHTHTSYPQKHTPTQHHSHTYFHNNPVLSIPPDNKPRNPPPTPTQTINSAARPMAHIPTQAIPALHLSPPGLAERRGHEAREGRGKEAEMEELWARWREMEAQARELEEEGRVWEEEVCGGDWEGDWEVVGWEEEEGDEGEEGWVEVDGEGEDGHDEWEEGWVEVDGEGEDGKDEWEGKTV
ncbi:hypothetical protein BDU57DRAFT_137983 [Ampelomyces quisqualis]|uniref:Uncharacterized protein n=1 Tax=Ampelomyces quisqualis TaxID=50730 RepID=A0A6A5QZP9_AMPQU|nr:hypothetical protein BDU57DRAFT_137983 [Ampelomyces quisqualis]